MPKIQVHEKALAHLSRGLYRSPASALRELVSNAWDANARTVRISTNYPHFFQLAVEDTGDGFSRDDFARLMGGGIGNSDKRPLGKPLVNRRQVIGRLGIGMLGIAQICGAFTITSRMKTGKGFRARIRLYDLLKEKLDRNDKEIVNSDREVDVGTYDFDDQFDLSLARFGTSIVSNDIHPSFVRAFQKSLSSPRFQKPPSKWDNAVKIPSRVHTIQELGDYWRLLWELAASCPVPYLSANSVPKGLIKDDQVRLTGFDFRVLVDNLELRKPILLKGNPGGYTTRLIRETTLKVYGKEVCFHGYILVQEGAQLKPDELRGILIRIKNVAIGYYDPSMLDYRFNEGPRSRWLTSEIYVTEGLEDALNIDRDSFNRFHPQFRAIQEHVHKILHEEIFPEVYKQIEVRSSARAEARRSERKVHLSQVLSKATSKKIVVRENKQSADESAKNVTVARKRNNVEIALPDERDVATKKANRQLANAILALFEIAMKERDLEHKRIVFRESLLDLLAKW
jgi:histidine kinase/DNA gyrase B/HSP90-like ATPase